MNDTYSVAEAKIGLTTNMESKRDYLLRIKKGMIEQMKDIDRALELFDKHPEMEELTNLLRRF